jgi:predicted PurR-regulated permease PerM
MGFANSLLNAFVNFFIGLIFALYILGSKETLKRQIKKLLKRISKTEIYDKIIHVASISNTIFGNYVKVQVLEAFILGVLCFIGMLIFGLPYALTISVLVAFTALIPIFGSLIGLAVGAFLIFMVSPIKALIFIVFFIILQQLEGNLIYPHVVGDKIGLPSIWVLVAVTIGGSIGGILGMLVGVPVVSVVYSLVKEFVNTKPKRDKLSTT